MNEQDLAELPPEVRREMTFVPARTLEDVLKVALPGRRAFPTCRSHRPAVACGLLLHLGARLRARLARNRGDQRARGRLPGVRHRRPHVGGAMAVRPDRRVPVHVHRRKVRHRNRADRQPAPRRSSARSPRRRVLSRPCLRASRAKPPCSRAHDAGFVDVGCPAARMRRRAGRRHPLGRAVEFHVGLDLRGVRARLAQAPGLVLATSATHTAARREAWRLPIHGGFATFDRDHRCAIHCPSCEERSGGRAPAAELPADRATRPVSFGGYGLNGFDPHRLDCLDTWGVVMTGRHEAPPLPAGASSSTSGTSTMRDCATRISSRAVDVVVTKPGFGIVAECIANNTAMLYTSRGRFVEYDVMVAEMPRFLRCEYLDLGCVPCRPLARRAGATTAAAPAAREATHRRSRGRGGADQGEGRGVVSGGLETTEATGSQRRNGVNGDERSATRRCRAELWHRTRCAQWMRRPASDSLSVSVRLRVLRSFVVNSVPSVISEGSLLESAHAQPPLVSPSRLLSLCSPLSPETGPRPGAGHSLAAVPRRSDLHAGSGAADHQRRAPGAG